MAFGYVIQEFGDSPKVTLARDSIRGTRRFLIPDSQQLDFALGMTSVSTGYGLGPAPFPRFPAARVESISFEPFTNKPDQRTISDPTWQYNTFDGNNSCVATVSYLASINNAETSDPRDDGLPEGTWATYSQRFSGEFMTLPGRALYWPTDNKPIGQDAHATIYIPIADHVITWNRVKSPPWNAISELRGQINDTDFRMPGSGQLREKWTLLFEGGEVSTEFKIDPTQPQYWNMTYTFKERRIKFANDNVVTKIYGWNHLYRADTGTWSQPETWSTSQKMYARTEFKRLFQFA